MAISYVSSGSVANNTLGGGNELYVLSSGTAVSTTVISGGAIYDYGGGHVIITSIDSGGELDVVGGGTASATTVNSGGRAYVTSGGVAGGTAVNSGGQFFMSGAASFTTINNGGAERVGTGGTQSATTIFAGGQVQMGGTEYATTIDAGGALYIVQGGVDNSALVGSGGYMEVDAGGDAKGVTIQGGGLEVAVRGTVAGTLMSGADIILAGTTDASGLTVEQGGRVISSGVAIVTSPGAPVQLSANINGQTLIGAGSAYILSGGVADHAVIGGLTTAFVFAGGTADDDTINQTLVIETGGAVSGSTIAGGVAVVSGGTIYSTTVSGANGYAADLNMFSGATSGTELGSGGSEVFFGAATADNTTIGNGGSIYFYTSAVTTNTTIQGGGAETLLNGGVASNTTIAGGTLDLTTGFGPFVHGTVAGGIDFTGGTLITDTTALPAVPITGFDIASTIEITDLAFGAGDTVTVATPGFVTISVGGSNYDFNIVGATSATSFALSEAANGDGLLLTEAPCFAAGTRILTPRGEIPVERLAMGDTVITDDGDDAPIVWIGRRRIDISRHPRPQQVRPVRIAAHAFADGVPSRDLLLSPDHALFLHGVLIPAKTLLNDRNIVQLNRAAVIYYHVELAAHSIIFAENCAVESYLETGNRAAFENAADATTLHPDFAQTLREEQSCAPFTDSGPLLEAAREQTLRQFYSMRRAANN